MRPKQWIKNLLLFAGLIFSKNFFQPQLLTKTIFGFIIFCLLSGVVYIINDLVDIKEDKLHPVKAKRPIASGKISPQNAYLAAIIIGIVGIVASFLIEPLFFLVTVAYLILALLYSIVLKKIVILDVIVIAVGFLLRALAGTVVIGVEISVWLFICVFLLALFIGFSKRRHEIVLLESAGERHRKTLAHYSPGVLDQLISVVTASTLVSYILYTVSAETVMKFGTEWLVLTTPFVLYGIFRYLWLVYQKKLGGAPEQSLLLDKPLLIDVILWIISVIIIIR